MFLHVVLYPIKSPDSEISFVGSDWRGKFLNPVLWCGGNPHNKTHRWLALVFRSPHCFYYPLYFLSELLTAVSFVTLTITSRFGSFYSITKSGRIFGYFFEQ